MNTGENEFLGQRTVLSFLFSYYHPKSVADIGCGYGLWVKACQSLGIQEVQGFDELDAPSSDSVVIPRWYKKVDMSNPFQSGKKYDLVISTEVAEHIRLEAAEIFIQNLCNASDIVLFSAALPNQGGIDHVNENWVEYWFNIFRSLDYKCFDIFRTPLWNDQRIAYFYRQNLLLYVKENKSKFFLDQGLKNNVFKRNNPPNKRQNEAEKRNYYNCVSLVGQPDLDRSGVLTHGEIKPPQTKQAPYGYELQKQSEVRNDHNKLIEEIKNLKSSQKMLENKLSALKSSKSWKLTKPLRWLAQFFDK